MESKFSNYLNSNLNWKFRNIVCICTICRAWFHCNYDIYNIPTLVFISLGFIMKTFCKCIWPALIKILSIYYLTDAKAEKTFISSVIQRITSIGSLTSILFIKPEFPCRAIRAPGVVIKFTCPFTNKSLKNYEK